MTVEDTSPVVADDEPNIERPPPRRRRRRSRPRRQRVQRDRGGLRKVLAERLTFGNMAGLLAGLLAFVVVATLLADRRETMTVMVATERIPAGLVLDESVVRPAEIPTSVDFAEELASRADVEAGAVVGRNLSAGEPIPSSALGGTRDSAGARAMSVPVDSWDAVGGMVAIGDQIDLIDVSENDARYVLSGALVVDRDEADDAGGLTGGRPEAELWVTVEVTEDEALDVAETIEGDSYRLVRSTGAGEE